MKLVLTTPACMSQCTSMFCTTNEVHSGQQKLVETSLNIYIYISSKANGCTAL